jgi:tetratricopeptide (TPR) repeat protein
MTHVRETESELRRALAAFQQGDLGGAEQIATAILARQPTNFDALHLLGIIATQTGRPERAVEWLGAAIAQKPVSPFAHINRGNALEKLGRFADALADYDIAITQYPGAVAAHVNRAAVLLRLHRHDAALDSADQAILLRPDFAEAHINRGNVLHDLARLDEALASFDRAIATRPDFAGAHNNRGTVSRDLGQFDAALASYDRAIALAPDFAEAHHNRGAVLRDLGRAEDAIVSSERAIALRPDYAEPYYNLSMCHLAIGDYRRGWELFEWRWNAVWAEPRQDLSGLPWLGCSPIEGKTILVHAEQGLGDSLQFCRYVPLLAARGATVILEVPRPLARLLGSLDGVAAIVATGEPPPRTDAWIPMMSLPLAFRTTLATIPAAMPYLHADPERRAFWSQRLAALPGRKIGLVWAGSARPGIPQANALDRRRSLAQIGRSMDLEIYAPIAAISGICLISLQKGDGAAPGAPDGVTLHDWTGELRDFADTAALVEALDLVISVDTSVAHLAGALGKPLWVLNRYDQCWRWLRDRTDSPWYPTARLFRQPSPGDWTPVIRDVADALLRG